MSEEPRRERGYAVRLHDPRYQLKHDLGVSFPCIDHRTPLPDFTMML